MLGGNGGRGLCGIAIGPVWGMLALCVMSTLCPVGHSLQPLLTWPSLVCPLLVALPETPFIIHPCIVKAFAGGL